MIRLIRLWAQPCFTPRQLPWRNGSYDLPWSGIFWYWVFVVNGENEEWKIASASGLWAELLLIEYATNLQHNNTKHITGANLARNAKPNCDASLNAAACYTASVSVFLSRKVLKKFNETGACRKSEFVKTRPYFKKTEYILCVGVGLSFGTKWSQTRCQKDDTEAFPWPAKLPHRLRIYHLSICVRSLAADPTPLVHPPIRFSPARSMPDTRSLPAAFRGRGARCLRTRTCGLLHVSHTTKTAQQLSSG